jgi:ubiquinone/menaquinone biosynthesis C-methylase UbiE
MDWDRYNKLMRHYLQQEIKDFASFVIHELNVDYQARILEIGCGPGWVSLELARRLPEATVIGVDQNSDLIQAAIQNKQEENISNVDFIQIGSEDLSRFSTNSFDVVISFKVFHQWTKAVHVLDEIGRIVTKSGKYAITDHRNDLTSLARAALWFSARTMPSDFRSHWRQMFENSYSVKQALKLFLGSQLKDWKLRTTMLDFLIFKD